MPGCARRSGSDKNESNAMVSASDNNLLTRVGPGTPMGELMRQYWIPACKSTELEADGPPMRLMLLGEKLIAFRDGAGRVGIMDQRCPHRCASLFYGRNEGDGLRCIYHGWKYDVTGRCLDMPNIPEIQKFTDRVVAKAYPTFERGGLVWTYLGARADAPPLPALEAVLLPAEETRIILTQRECNWLQALEGDIDTSHFGFLHMGSIDTSAIDRANMHSHALLNKAPEYHVEETSWGTMYAAWRRADPGDIYYRVSHFVFPFWVLVPDGKFEDNISVDAWVPMDDAHTMVFNLAWTRRSPPLRTFKDGRNVPGLEFRHDFLPNTNDWFGRWRLAVNRGNDHMIDRSVQRADSFSGIPTITAQDVAVVESMGDIVDRSMEHLAASDRMIVLTRQRLLKAATALAEKGIMPPGVDDPEIVLRARSGAYVASESVDWRAAYAERLRRSISPAGMLRAAETVSVEE